MFCVADLINYSVSGQHLLTSPVYNEAQIPLAFWSLQISSLFYRFLLHLCRFPFPLLLYSFIFSLLHINSPAFCSIPVVFLHLDVLSREF